MTNNRAFTLIEVTVVLVLISIIAAAVFARSVSTDRMNTSGEVSKIRNHIRFAQSVALKRGETRGLKSDGNRYWMFIGADPDSISNQTILPGAPAVKVSLPNSLSMSPFTVFFDKFGRPCDAYTEASGCSPLAGEMIISLSGSPQSLAISPETGFITVR